MCSPQLGRSMVNQPTIPLPTSPIPADDLSRNLVIARQSEEGSLIHVGVVGDTYTILLAGKDTGGRYCLIDMLIPPGGGPGPHRHDFEESFTILEGEIEATFRGKKAVFRAGETVNIPANAPHHFTNKTEQPARMLCICSPSGVEEFFVAIGQLVESRTTTPPKLDPSAQAAFFAKAGSLASKYRTEILKPEGA